MVIGRYFIGLTFYRFLTTYETSENCNIIGSPFQSDIKFDTFINLNQDRDIYTSRFRFYHTPLRTRQDYINALKVTKELVQNSQINGFAYSKFYSFMEQFLYMDSLTLKACLLAIGKLDWCGN